MAKSKSNRIISTPSQYAREHYLYVQEVGTLQSLEPHVSRRQNLSSYLFFLVLDGNGSVSYEGRTYPISAGDCVWLDCTKPYSHESSADAPWSLMWIHFNGKNAASYYDAFKQQNNFFLFRPRNLVLFTSFTGPSRKALLWLSFYPTNTLPTSSPFVLPKAVWNIRGNIPFPKNWNRCIPIWESTTGKKLHWRSSPTFSLSANSIFHGNTARHSAPPCRTT